MNISALLPNQSLAKSGVWRTFFPPTAPEQSFEMLLAYDLPAYRESVEKRFAAARRELDGARIGTTQSNEITTRAMIGTLLLDWRGLEQDGQPLAFTEDTAARLLLAYPALEFFVRESAGDVRNFQDKPAPVPASADSTEGEATQANDLKSDGAVGAGLPRASQPAGRSPRLW